MKCDHIQELLSSYMDDRCNPRDKTSVEVHLEHCSACRQEFEQLQSLCAYLAEMSDMKAPEGLAASVQRQVHKENLYILKKPEPQAPRRGAALIAAVAAAAVLLGILASGLMPTNYVSVALDKWFGPAVEEGATIDVQIEDLVHEAWQKLQQEEAAPLSDEPPVTVVAEEPETAGEPQPLVVATVEPPEDTVETVLPVELEPDPEVESKPAPEPESKPEPVAEPERQVATQYSSKMKIADAGAAIQTLYELGDAYGASPMLVPTESRLMSEQEGVVKSRLVYLQVTPENAPAVLHELEILGFAAPTLAVTDRTDEWEEVLDSLAAVERVMAGDGQESNLSAAHRDALNNYQQELRAKQQEVEQSVNLVTIELLLLEVSS